MTPLGPDGLPLPADSDAAKQRREQLEQKKRDKAARKEKLRRDKEARARERERRRRERKRRSEADPLKAEWLPILPPKHSWKHTPVRSHLPFHQTARLPPD